MLSCPPFTNKVKTVKQLDLISVGKLSAKDAKFRAGTKDVSELFCGYGATSAGISTKEI